MFTYRQHGSVHWSVLLTVVLFVALIITAAWQFFHAPANKMDVIVSEDLAKMAQIFKRIEEKCNVTGLVGQKDNIDFLNVKSFVGKEIGPLTLAYPEKWEGPYTKDNPTIQGKFYQIVKTLKGYFIVPGDGVKLPNGKVIGKDIKIDESADLPAMLKDEQQLMYRGKSLGVQLDISTSVFDDLLAENIIADDDGFAMKAQDSMVKVAVGK